MPNDLPKCPLTFLWDEEQGAWLVRVGDYITVTFYPENQVLVEGSLMTMNISYDPISESRGIMFKEEKL